MVVLKRKLSLDAARLGRVLGLMTVGAALPLATLGPSAAKAQPYAVGSRVECDPTGLKKYYESGTVIATHPGETFNGYAADTGYFNRVYIDRRDPDGTLCKADDMRPARAAAAEASPAQGQPDTFGTRNPRMCSPVRSQPSSAAQIATLVQCYREDKTRDLIYLMEHISVEAGRTRPYNYESDHLFTNIDTTAPVLPIRGSLDQYQCAKISKPIAGDTYGRDNTGQNCAVSPERRASGICYRTTFGDWQCDMMEATDPSLTRLNQPPPVP